MRRLLRRPRRLCGAAVRVSAGGSAPHVVRLLPRGIAVDTTRWLSPRTTDAGAAPCRHLVAIGFSAGDGRTDTRSTSAARNRRVRPCSVFRDHYPLLRLTAPTSDARSPPLETWPGMKLRAVHLCRVPSSCDYVDGHALIYYCRAALEATRPIYHGSPISGSGVLRRFGTWVLSATSTRMAIASFL